MAKTRLQKLYDEQQQSPWLDNLKRAYLTSGDLQRLVDEGIRGVTSNPTIFAKAISGSADYDEQFRELVKEKSVEDAYWDMAIQDVQDALKILRPVHDQENHHDGFVSIEVSPAMAADTEATVKAARRLHERTTNPTLSVKTPATADGFPAMLKMFAEGCNIN